MRRLAVLVLLLSLAVPATARAEPRTTGGGDLDPGSVTVWIAVTAPGSPSTGQSGDDAGRPLVTYTVSWSVDTTSAQIGSLDGLCAAPGSTATVPVFGFLYHLVGTDPTGAVVDDRFECVAFVNGDVTQRPPPPPLPAVPTLGEAWNSAHIPAPAVTLDPPTRGITGLDTRISTAGPTTAVVAATIRGFTITGTAILDHYEISVDDGPASDAGRGHYTFETTGNHTVAISAIWTGTATITGPGLTAGGPAVDIGTATITSTRTYPVREVRSVLQP